MSKNIYNIYQYIILIKGHIDPFGTAIALDNILIDVIRVISLNTHNRDGECKICDIWKAKNVIKLKKISP